MNLQDYIEQIKGWIGRQCFIVRHYRIAIFIFFILALAMIVVGIFYPHEEEHINIISAQSEGTIDNQRKVDAKEQSQKRPNKNRSGNDNEKSSKEGVDNKSVHDEKENSIVKGRLLYDVSSIERSHPWREVFKDISSTDLLSQNDETKDMDNDLDTISNDETSISNSKKISNKITSRQHRSTKNKFIKTDRKNKDWNSNMIHDDTNNYSNESVHSRTNINSNALTLEQPIELVGIIEGNQKIAILRRGSEEQILTIGSSWQGISVSAITENSVEIVEGGSSRWLKIE
ncbi:hypothetical protein [Veillonella sp. oral taxon 158]|uniref:hypothetical protein n=1 Tax=Veillonella sp. oral taxon 158 TaxID=671228 RepID=UPI0001EB42BD|nr:hypothetical protein [Veillonella sp. oral taxon 158]EFR61071.1 hypothetical protein HMPREF9199_0626 [Veillonella sp. oral taxon 158 str. F0412]